MSREMCWESSPAQHAVLSNCGSHTSCMISRRNVLSVLAQCPFMAMSYLLNRPSSSCHMLDFHMQLLRVHRSADTYMAQTLKFKWGLIPEIVNYEGQVSYNVYRISLTSYQFSIRSITCMCKCCISQHVLWLTYSSLYDVCTLHSFKRKLSFVRSTLILLDIFHAFVGAPYSCPFHGQKYFQHFRGVTLPYI